jgi:peptide/nickel transport system permease protein
MGIPSLVAGVSILGFFAVVGALSPWLYPGDPTTLSTHVGAGYSCPAIASPTLTFFPFHTGPYPLGQTGGLGFNVLEGLVKGTPWDLLLLLEVAVPALVMGLLLGSYAGFRGGLIDDVLMAVTDAFLAVPEIVVVLLASLFVLGYLDPSYRLWVFGLLFLLVAWAPYARSVRAQARIVSTQPYVESSRASGGTDRWVLFRHILPNSLYPVFAQIPTTLAGVLAILGGLQYAYVISNPNLCVGTGPPPLPLLNAPNFPEWTWTLANGASAWTFGTANNPWWGTVYPALWILLFGLGVILTCDGLGRLTSSRSA